ncbi:hypothetical protein PoB_002613900 [Plakobranchus ocellatus]|uniref:Uncharacterized protein n=1 Tax=Plakobranchus ocellatus TaxID=259542 RepID=A0AAV3ZZ42_9GAST|nr:hypothetical protein PoB_002613900 [Plakobranchus ocellatus]
MKRVGFLYIASLQQGDLRLSGPPSGQGAGRGARTRDRRVPADLRADSQATVLPTPLENEAGLLKLRGKKSVPSVMKRQSFDVYISRTLLPSRSNLKLHYKDP